MTVAVRLQWLSFMLGFAIALERLSWNDIMEWGVGLASTGIYAALIAWLIFKLARGRNWARITYTVVSLLGYVSIATSWPTYSAAYHGHPELVALDVLNTLADIGGLCLMYTKAANAWFRSRARPTA